MYVLIYKCVCVCALKEFGSHSGWGLIVLNILLPLLISSVRRESVCVGKAFGCTGFLKLSSGACRYTFSLSHTHTLQQGRIKGVTRCRFPAHLSFCLNPNHGSRPFLSDSLTLLLSGGSRLCYLVVYIQHTAHLK